MTGQDLKNSILQLAIQGKLVAQDANDEPASVLLERIKAEKKKLIEEKKIKKEKTLAKITENEKPFEIPDSWVWVRLGEIVSFIGGYAYKSQKFVQDSTYQVLRLGNVKNDTLRLSVNPVFISKDLAILTEKYKCITNDILITMTGTRKKRDYFYTYKVSEKDCNLFINQRVGALRPYKGLPSDYLCYSLKSETVLLDVFQYETGTANQGNLGAENIMKILIPLPPLSEQKRIVAKIEELMPLVDEYDKAQKELDALNSAMPEQLKQSILQEAIMGKLGTNNPDDEPASELLKRIRKEKEQLIKDKKIKKEKPLPEITEDEIPFEIPDNWVWCRWGDLSFSIQYGYNASAQQNGDIRMVRISDIQNNEVLWDSVPYCKIKAEEIEGYLLKPNDILFARTGGTVGKSFLVKKVPYPSIYAGYLIRTRYSNNLVPQYLKYFMESRLYWEQLREGTIATAQPNCNGKTLGNMRIPLPPLAEQHRIVSKIENLFACIEPLAKDVK